MRLSSLGLACALSSLFPLGASAYNDTITHPGISRVAVGKSVLATDPDVLKRLGLVRIPFGGAAYVFFPDGEGVQLEEIFAYGAYAEDAGSRAFNHFYDPYFNRPLTVGIELGKTSPAWSLEDEGQISGQDDSFLDAREAFYQALTKPAAAGQTDYWIKTFQALGQVIHHVQDMAQPQHTRNDQHLDKYSFFGLNPFYNPSRYEFYTRDANDNVLTLAAQGQAVFPGPSDFKLPRDFWRNGAGSGMAEFTNRSFVSQGTNFAMLAGQVAMPDYPAPTPGTPVDYRIDDLYAQSNLPVPEGIQALCSLVTIDCRMTMYPAGPSLKASTLSIFDQDLEARAAIVTYTGYRAPTYTTNRLFALNRFNFDDAHLTLIPKAVSYSAGLINYFFRGTMEVSLPDEGIYAIVDHSQVQVTDPAAGFVGFNKIKLKLANTTPGGEAMSGGTLQAILRFRRNLLFKDDLSQMPDQVDAFGARSTAEEIVLSDVKSGVSLGAAPQPFTFNFVQSLPINATDVSLQIVYRGVLGQEQDAVAVTTKNISEPTYYTYHNFSDYIRVGGQPYTRDEVNADGALLAQIQPQSCIDPQTGKLQSYCFQTFTISMDLNFGTNGGNRLASVNALDARQFLRLAWLGDANANTQLINNGPCTPNNDAVKPTSWELRYDASGAATLYSPIFNKLRGVWGWYQTSCVWSGDNVPAADNWADRMTPLNPVPAPITLNMNFQ